MVGNNPYTMEIEMWKDRLLGNNPYTMESEMWKDRRSTSGTQASTSQKGKFK